MSAFAIRPTRSFVPVLLHMLDSILLCISLPLVQWLTNKPINELTAIVSLVSCIALFVIGELCGYYRRSGGQSANSEVALGTIAWIITFVSILLVGVFTKQIDTFARSSMVAWFFVGGLLLLCSHMVVRAAMEYLCKLGVGVRRTAIIGANRLGYDIARNAIRSADSGLRIVGFYDDRGAERRQDHEQDLPDYCGTTAELMASTQRGEIDVVLIALPMRAEKRIQDLLDVFGNTTASVYIVPDFFVFELLHSRWTQVGGLPVVSVFETPMYGVDGWVKRALDLSVSLIGVILISPILLICALLVRFTSQGPVFFRQKRYGLDGKEILVWKFRSMFTCDNGSVVKQATKDDPRVTPVGRILRRTSLDELPQLFNVIDGSMSLVGPRPHANAHNEHYRKLIRGYMMRHKVKPGITGLAQVEGSRGETDTIEKMEARIALDHRYIREWSLWLDIKLILKTFRVVLRQDAY
ncbi:undecaprenyl-phosphate glucose phosphotransferase [Pirellula sp. SH-Sr6A]|uniref:undecaprenyl-phosphate glucose phosphotransferase n=1 Tax=Pirellula sp. SH-Sr6A TaxID=1632865 RepID=UPI0011BAD981|nr:undecaprenyl-phosphate glucose phosphotransferase [Pirellula sp. SH-Sr6A]